MSYRSSIGYLALMYGEAHYSILMETAHVLNDVAANDLGSSLIGFPYSSWICFLPGTRLVSPGWVLQELTLQFCFQFFNCNIILIVCWKKIARGGPSGC